MGSRSDESRWPVAIADGWCDDVGVERFEVDLLRLAQVERDTALVRFLYSERRQGEEREIALEDVAVRLAAMEHKGWVERTASRGWWLITALGHSALLDDESWEFVVEEVTPSVGEPGHHADGRLRQGTAQRGDLFRVHRDGDHQASRSGGVERVEIMDRGDRPGLLILKVVGVDLAPGDVLRRWEPVVGGYAGAEDADAGRASVGSSSLAPFSFPGSYEDDSGAERIEWHVTPYTGPSRRVPSFEIRTVIRGTEFWGFDFDGLEAVDRVAADVAGFDSTADLTNCVLSGDIPGVFDDDGHRVRRLVSFRLDLVPRSDRPYYDPKNLRLSTRVGDDVYEVDDDWFEDGLQRLELLLPNGVRLASCVTCLYSDYSPGGHGLTGMSCHRGTKTQYLAVRSKLDYWSVPETEEVMETHLCGEYERRIPGTGYRG